MRKRLLPVFYFCYLLPTIVLAVPPAITFSNTCQTGNKIVIVAVGDILLHRPLQVKGMQAGFKSLWQAAVPYIQQADIAYANLEGPIANGLDYTGYPAFNYPPKVADAMHESGFDIVSTANNHALDRSSIGIHKTLQNLDRVGLLSVGTRNYHEPYSWVKIITRNNITTAWLACTEHTNGIDDTNKEVLHCFSKNNRALIFNTIHFLKNKVDAIIVTPHWGEEYQSQPNFLQKQFAHELLNAGATLVLGSHPHVLQPLEKFITIDGRSTVIMYSLGNFVSYQSSPRMKNTIVLLIGLTKTNQGTFINGVRYIPMEMENRSGINNIKISKAPNDEVIKHVLPVENVSDGKLVTNPECK